MGRILGHRPATNSNMGSSPEPRITSVRDVDDEARFGSSARSSPPGSRRRREQSPPLLSGRLHPRQEHRPLQFALVAPEDPVCRGELHCRPERPSPSGRRSGILAFRQFEHRGGPRFLRWEEVCFTINLCLQGYIQRPWGLPGGHPNCDNYFIYQELPVADLPSVYFDHPDIQEAYLNGEHLPDGHPSVFSLHQLRKVLPIGHPDVDDLFLDHEELPEWHPDLNLIVQDNPIEPIYVFSGHPDLTDDDEIGEPVDDHPTVHHLFAEHIPDSHPNIDDLMQEGFVLPSWHPKIGSIVIPRSSFTSPGFLLCAGVTVLFIAFLAARVITKWRNSKRTTEIVVTRCISTDKSDGGNDEVSVSPSDEGDIEVVMQRDNV
ncbi:hypothetical protein ACHAWF_016792 [Thalassiosira exigua]